jgi:hypothetical protein
MDILVKEAVTQYLECQLPPPETEALQEELVKQREELDEHRIRLHNMYVHFLYADIAQGKR